MISLLLAISPNTMVHGMLFWLMGDLGHSAPPWWSALILVVALCVSFYFARSLNVLAYGEKQAQSLGVSVSRMRVLLYLFGSLLTAMAVTLAGSVGFVGLVVPHMLRLIGGGDHRWLLPAAALLGGSLVVVADTLARTLLAPQQLPVGVVTAFIGVPLFLYLLYRGSGSFRS
jgi:iron complex transport system permease protein